MGRPKALGLTFISIDQSQTGPSVFISSSGMWSVRVWSTGVWVMSESFSPTSWIRALNSHVVLDQGDQARSKSSNSASGHWGSPPSSWTQIMIIP